jgi:hypothetical protein
MHGGSPSIKSPVPKP